MIFACRSCNLSVINIELNTIFFSEVSIYSKTYSNMIYDNYFTVLLQDKIN